MMNERDGADAAMEEAARLQIELDELHAKAHRIQLRQEAAEAEAVRLRAALGRVRQGFLNILDCRRFEFGDEFRYGALHRQEVETEIKLLDAALGGLLTPTASDEAEARWNQDRQASGR